MDDEDENRKNHDDQRKQGAEEGEDDEEEAELFTAVVETLDMAHRARDKNEDSVDKIPADDCDCLSQRLRTADIDDPYHFLELLTKATLLRYDEIAMALYPHLHNALLCPRNEGDFDALDDLLYRIQTDPRTTSFPGRLSLESDMSQQIALRVLSYHAIHTKDYPLFRWLVKSGLQPCELHGTYDPEKEDVTSLYEWSSYISNRSQLPDTEMEIRLPSLLVVAASQNNTR
ncbi:hypothetical protein EK21DRAFT_108062 [Setomelanomma holmii]|uniref:Uncharacterized protein n=1 Tax=Setomelanomma holmii TaxID=210430 RepID=A0A9P4LS61_9PLEO|nr:hypothetical protein EK21DRAFT_108062 [Setomelanomma holmii]